MLGQLQVVRKRRTQPAATTLSFPHPDVAYSQAIDVWSVGCILAELLELLKVRFPQYTRAVAVIYAIQWRAGP
jgi:hypothetical protein